jgi:hypothetical protein
MEELRKASRNSRQNSQCYGRGSNRETSLRKSGQGNVTAQVRTGKLHCASQDRETSLRKSETADITAQVRTVNQGVGFVSVEDKLCTCVQNVMFYDSLVSSITCLGLQPWHSTEAVRPLYSNRILIHYVWFYSMLSATECCVRCCEMYTSDI